MKTFELVALLCAVTGFVLVVGSLILLYHGVIKLREKAEGKEMEADFKNQLKVTIRNPALCLFALGLAFFATALWFCRPGEIPPGEIPGFKVKGHVDAGDIKSLRLLIVARFPLEITSSGDIDDTLRGRLHEKLWYEINAAGHDPPYLLEKIDAGEARSGQIVIKELRFEQKIKSPKTTGDGIKNPDDYPEESEKLNFYK